MNAWLALLFTGFVGFAFVGLILAGITAILYVFIGPFAFLVVPVGLIWQLARRKN